MARTIQKTVWNGEAWEKRTFVFIPNINWDLIMWLTEHYGKPKYQLNWWKTYSETVVDEKIYTHWMLLK